MSKCAICRAPFERRFMSQAERAERKARIDKITPIRVWKREAQLAVNAFVRARDEGLPCISCGRHHEGQYQAGHYLSRGANPELALEPRNIHRQCVPCNLWKSGNQALFRAGLVLRYGEEYVQWLEGYHPPKHYSVEDLKAIRNEYRAKLKALKSEGPAPEMPALLSTT